METDLLKLLEAELTPDPYSQFVQAADDNPTLFARQDRGNSHYVLAVKHWSTDIPPLAQLGQVRRQVGSYFDASFFRGVGLIVLWYGSSGDWSLASEVLKTDKHGLRSTIVQGIVFLDLESGMSQIKQCSWGPIKFGNRKKTFDKIRTTLDKYRQLLSEM